MYLPSITAPSMWATFSAQGASQRAMSGIMSASSWVRGARTLMWPSLSSLKSDLAKVWEAKRSRTCPSTSGRAGSKMSSAME